MSTADRSVRRSGGFTFIETVIVLAIVSMLALVLGQTVGSTQKTEEYLKGVRRATERAQRLAFELRSVVGASHRLFSRDADGLGYLKAIDLGPLTVRGNARLPVTDGSGELAPDAPGDSETGNMLLFARESDPAPCVADVTTKKIRAIDTYRFVFIFPALTSRRLLGDAHIASDLVIWRSEAFPNATQITAISDPKERASVVSDLVSRFGYDMAWDPAQPVDTAFFALGAAGAIASTPTAGLKIQEDLAVSERGRLVHGDVELSDTDASNPASRSLLTADDPATWKPDGFEVKVADRSGHRKVWIHLCVETPGGPRRVAYYPLTMVVSAQDM
jgi:prepilin-type N-terminal cleavage/methylation domain-containing protein